MTKDFLREVQHYINLIIPGYGFGIAPGSDVHINPDKYGIVFKEDGTWESEHNNEEIRNERLKDFLAFCRTLKVDKVWA